MYADISLEGDKGEWKEEAAQAGALESNNAV